MNSNKTWRLVKTIQTIHPIVWNTFLFRTGLLHKPTEPMNWSGHWNMLMVLAWPCLASGSTIPPVIWEQCPCYGRWDRTGASAKLLLFSCKGGNGRIPHITMSMGADWVSSLLLLGERLWGERGGRATSSRRHFLFNGAFSNEQYCCLPVLIHKHNFFYVDNSCGLYV